MNVCKLITISLITLYSSVSFAMQKQRIFIRSASDLRSAIVLRPTSKASKSPGLLFIFHGGNGSAKETLDYTNIEEYVDKNNLVVILPDALKDPKKNERFWNDGRSETSHLGDDVQLTKDLIEYAARNYQVDNQKVFASGISNGGLLTSRLICEESDLFAGFIQVISNMPEDLAKKCHIKSSINVMMVNGTKDTFMPYQGGEIPSSRKKGLSGKVIGTPDTLRMYKRANRCQSTQKIKMKNNDRKDQTLTYRYKYSRCSKGKKIQFYQVRGGNHGYPTPRIESNPAGRDFETTQLIINFINSI